MASSSPDAHDPVLRYMVRHMIPLTRENWLELSYPDGPPKDWGPELEAEVPNMFKLRGRDHGRGGGSP